MKLGRIENVTARGVEVERRPHESVLKRAEWIATNFSRVTPREERERVVTIVRTSERTLDAAIARALALAERGEHVQIDVAEWDAGQMAFKWGEL